LPLNLRTRVGIISMTANFLTGPVALHPEVVAAFVAAPVSHRDRRFLDTMSRTRASLNTLVNARHVALLVGSGTLANDAVAAQLTAVEGGGLILSNGEFGERVIDHARRWKLGFMAGQQHWGQPFDWKRVRQLAERCRPTWIWAVLTETSTGVMNPLAELLELCESVDADLCLDAVSAIGLMPVDLQRVRFATAVSGKGLAAFPGLAAVFHDGRLARPGRLPRYLDLADYEATDSVPFTHSSNLLAALDRSLTLTSWPRKFAGVRQRSQMLRAALRSHALPPLAQDECAAPGIVTVPIPNDVSAADLGHALSEHGIQVGYQSRYLQQRNWLQICLMGELDEATLRLLPALLVKQVATLRGTGTLNYCEMRTAAPPEGASLRTSTSDALTSRALSFNAVAVSPSS
jgi:aspartate aminotransferase-like enzyme